MNLNSLLNAEIFILEKYLNVMAIISVDNVYVDRSVWPTFLLYTLFFSNNQGFSEVKSVDSVLFSDSI